MPSLYATLTTVSVRQRTDVVFIICQCLIGFGSWIEIRLLLAHGFRSSRTTAMISSSLHDVCGKTFRLAIGQRDANLNRLTKLLLGCSLLGTMELAAAGNILARELMVQKGMTNIPTLR